VPSMMITYFTPAPTLISLLPLRHAPPPDIYTLSLHDALPIYGTSARHCRYDRRGCRRSPVRRRRRGRRSPRDPQTQSSRPFDARSEEHTSELQSRGHLVCRLLLEKKKVRSVGEGVLLLYPSNC